MTESKDELWGASERATLLTGLLRRAGESPDLELSDGEAEALLAVATAAGAPTEMLNDWNEALRLCTMLAPKRNRDLARKVVDAIGTEILDRRQLPDAIARTSALVVLERLVLAAVVVDERNLARRALQRLTARIGELFLVADLGPAFLAMRPVGVFLRDAALLAFDKGDLKLAVEIAEGGRMKLLSAVAAGDVSPLRETEPEQPDLASIPAPVALTLLEPEPEAIIDLVDNRLTEAELSAALIALTQPWERLVSTREATPTGSRVPDEIWRRALSEPSLEGITQSLGDEQLLVYPFVTEERVGMILVAADGTVSLVSDGVQDFSAEENHWIAGAGLVDFLQEDGRWADRTDIHFVAWDPNSELATQQISTGAWLIHDQAQTEPEAARTEGPAPTIIPSARLLESAGKPSPTPPEAISFLGDPTCDLAGPWVEAGGWHCRFGDRVDLKMGAAATSGALIEGLREADLVVVSGHGFPARSDGAFGITLADGAVTHADLLEVAGDVRASTAILSCCWAASSARGAVEIEVIGLATTLLALGVQQVLAPLIPIDDRATSIVGVTVAGALANGLDLRRALPAATAVADSDPIRAPSVLPSALAKICPHNQDALDSCGAVGKADYLETLGQFAVFGGAG